jgi:predicted Zn-dependent protease
MARDLERFVSQPQVWRRRLGIAAAALAAVALVWSLVHFLQPPPEQHISNNHRPDPEVARPPALQHFRLDIRRDGKGSIPKTQEDLDRLFPLQAGDKLRIAAAVPSGLKVRLFTVTLTDPGFKVQELKLERAGDKLQVPGLVPLEGSPATEVLFLCGSRDSFPRLEDVAALLADLSRKTGASAGDEALVLPRLLSFQSDKVDDPLHGLIGAGEEDPEQRVAALLDKLRLKLRGKYVFIAGISFTHVPGALQGKAKRALPSATPTIPTEDNWGGTAEQQMLFREVMGRLLQTKQVRDNYPAECTWPPKFYILPKSEKVYNAFAGPYALDKESKKYLVRAVITEGFLNGIVKEDGDILSAVMGHELAHITLGHLRKRIIREVAGLALGRQQEIDADLEGVRIAVAAGYDFRSGIRNAFHAWKVLGSYSNFEGIRATHPSWTERLRLLDQKRARIWSAMSAFQNGYFFLHAEQYRTAEACFQNVVDEFPDCAEAWANLGYARLMQYFDGLTALDLRKYGIAQVVAGAFYARPQGLISPRGDEKKWRSAVLALKTALVKDPNLILAQGNLGLAYLVHPDGEKKTEEALGYFRKAYKLKDKGLDGLNLAAFLVNNGVAELAAGRSEQAGKMFAVARKYLPAKGSAIRDQLELAILYNEAIIAAASTDKDTRIKAFHGLEDYLRRASPEATWWSLAFEKYDKLGQELDLKRESRETLAKRARGKRMRLLASVEFAQGKLITLSERTRLVLKRLGQEKSVGVPIYRSSRVKRYFEIAPGIDLLADHLLLAVFLTSPKAPPVYVQASGGGAKKQPIRVGMTMSDFVKILDGQPFERRFLDKPKVEYLFLPTLGLGIRYAEGKVTEIVLAQIPRK